KVLQTLETQKGARTIVLNKTTHQLYLPTAEYGARPEPTKENPHPRAKIKPGTFTVLVVGE
ncbi:MAG TPA: YncE family protein, partial [Bacteroidia bacterium]|nr:YncE family protein [Bacteroidia bacterium]